MFAAAVCPEGEENVNINICENVADYIFLTDITNCQNYYICVKGQPILQTCNDDRYFDASSQSCITTNEHCINCNVDTLSVYPLYRTCNKFVMCFSGQPLIRQCADNLQFNQTSEKCDLPSRVDCVENLCPVDTSIDDIIYTRSLANCSKFYVCMDGEQNGIWCSPGLQFNTETNLCDYASQVQCNITVKTRSSVFLSAINVEPEPAVDFACPSEGIQYFSHELANKYYLCTEGVGTVLTCSDGLVYDQLVHDCRLPKMRVKLCLLTIAFAGLFSVGITAKNEVQLCSDVADYIFLPFINNCSKYYVCFNGTAIEQQCEDGFFFDSHSQSCTYESDAKCLPTCPESALTSFCYDRTCTKYVLCYAGTPVLRECCDGLQYNAETDRCDFPQYVDCVDNLCTSINDADNIVFIASKASCEKYYVCVDGQPQNQTCANGLQFNPGCNCCDFPSKANCTISNLQRSILPYSRAPPRRADITCPEEGAQFFPHKSRSDAYYFCLNGRGVTLDCTPGLVYDENLESCREEQNVEA